MPETIFQIHPSTQNIIDQMRALKVPIDLGSSCSYKEDRIDELFPSHEIRTPAQGQSSDADFWKAIDKAIKHKLKIAANIVNYEGWFMSEAEYRAKFRKYLIPLYERNYPMRIDDGNESMKRFSMKQAGKIGNWLVDENKKIAAELGKERFLIGSGCEELGLAYSKRTAEYPLGWYQYQEIHGLHDVRVLHIQSTFSSPGLFAFWKNWWETTFMTQPWYKADMPQTCNEGNWMRVGTLDGFNLLLQQIKLAMEWKCTDFNIVFLKLKDWKKYKWLAFLYDDGDGYYNKSIVRIGTAGDGQPIYQDNYQILSALAKEFKTKRKDTTMLLEKFYYWRKEKFKRDPEHYGDWSIQIFLNNEIARSNIGIQGAFEKYNAKYTDPSSPDYEEERNVLVRIPNEEKLIEDRQFGERTAAVLEAYQEYKEIDDDGIVGPITFDNMVDDNFVDYVKVMNAYARESEQ